MAVFVLLSLVQLGCGLTKAGEGEPTSEISPPTSVQPKESVRETEHVAHRAVDEKTALTAPHGALIVRPTDSIPAIDGQMDPIYGEHASYFTGFAVTGGSKRVDEQTEVWLLTTSQGLFIVAKCALADGRGVFAADPRQGGAFWLGEDIEILLASAPVPGAIHHFGIDPDGHQFAKSAADSSFAPEWKVATSAGQGYWIAEALIPWEAIGFSPENGARLWFNVGRSRNAEFGDKSTYSQIAIGTSGSFDDAMSFPYLEFSHSKADLNTVALLQPLDFQALKAMKTPSGTRVRLEAQRFNGTVVEPYDSDGNLVLEPETRAVRMIQHAGSGESQPLGFSPWYATGYPDLGEDLRQTRNSLEQASPFFKELPPSMAALTSELDAIVATIASDEMHNAPAGALVEMQEQTRQLRERVMRETQAVVAAQQGQLGDRFLISVENSMRKIRPASILTLSASPKAAMSAAHGEWESTQIVVKNITDQAQSFNVQADLAGLESIQVRRAQQVVIKPEESWPDPLLPLDKNTTVSLLPGEQTAVWITCKIPTGMDAGFHSGRILLSSGNEAVEIPLALQVFDFEIPVSKNLSTSFWLCFPTLSRWYERPLTKDEKFRWVDLALAHRIDPFNAFGIMDYTNIRGIKSVQKSDGTISYDFQEMDEFLEFGFARGMKQFNVTGKVHSTWMFRDGIMVFDEKSGKSSLRKWSFEDSLPEVENFFRQASAHYKTKGWADRAVLMPCDEPPHDSRLMAEIGAFVEKARAGWPGLPTLVAGPGYDRRPDLRGIVTDWCPLTSHYSKEGAREARAAGDRTWWYVALNPKSPPYANFFIDQPASDHRILFWQTWQYEAEGFLWWGLGQYPLVWHRSGVAKSVDPLWRLADAKKWPDHPWNDMNHRGDGHLIYPGQNAEPVSSIRLEMVRDGLEDYEYFVLLRDLLEKMPDLSQERREHILTLLEFSPEISQSLTSFTADPDQLAIRRAAIAAAISELKQMNPSW